MGTSRTTRRCAAPLAAGLLLAAGLSAGCGSALRSAGIRLLYRQAPPAPRVLRDVPYHPGSAEPKHRLDLFLPAAHDAGSGAAEESPGKGWPVLVFVHGGGWDQGDKGLTIADADVYGNIGRFYAERGIGTVIPNYRLQPEAGWRQQVEDVARAVAWTRSHVARYGGDPRALFLSGHSAGAQLAAYVALDPSALGGVDLGPEALCGVIPVSGAAFDMTDEETYRLGADREYLEKRFGDGGEGWTRRASATTHLSPAAPPFLLLHGAYEWRSLAHQNRLLDRALRQAGVASQLRVARQLHQTMVLALARDDRLPARAVLSFIRGASCPPPGPSGAGSPLATAGSEPIGRAP